MAGVEDTELVRVFTNEVGEAFADLAFAVNQNFEVTVEGEAGSSPLAQGVQFNTNIVVQDVTANNNIPANPAAGFSGQIGSAAWPNANQKFTYTVNSADLAGRENHLCQVIAWLTTGLNNQDVSFSTSPYFLITNP
jgi:hypothetical protein